MVCGPPTLGKDGHTHKGTHARFFSIFSAFIGERARCNYPVTTPSPGMRIETQSEAWGNPPNVQTIDRHHIHIPIELGQDLM